VVVAAWAAGLYAAGVLASKALRTAALLSVAVSVAVALVCAAAAPVHGFGLRLPYGFGSPLLQYAGHPLGEIRPAGDLKDPPALDSVGGTRPGAAVSSVV
jgi:hypothetical protein